MQQLVQTTGGAILPAPTALTRAFILQEQHMRCPASQPRQIVVVRRLSMLRIVRPLSALTNLTHDKLI